MRGKPYQEGDEPVSGYRLEKYLGRGGFGEVWEACGPGGVHLAVKIIYGLERKKGGKELRALELLKDIRHPNIVPLTGFWLKTADGMLIGDGSSSDAGQEGEPLSSGPASGAPMAGKAVTAVVELMNSDAEVSIADAEELVIAMGLAERSLFDLLTQYQHDGRPGIDFDELLTYMDDASRAIDLLNTKHNIQHCDIKPQNILVQSGAAQVADFGLATSIGNTREQSMFAATIAYAAPEVLLGKGPGRATDQYSLAITYYELRTGKLPFESERISDVFDAKRHGIIQLSDLAADEREVISKAAAAAPEDRYRSAGEMVRALSQCGSGHARASRSRADDDTAACVSGPLTDTSSPRSTRVPWTSGGGTKRRRPVIGLVGGGVAVAIILAIVALVAPNDPEPGGPIAEETGLPGEVSAAVTAAADPIDENTGKMSDGVREAAGNTALAVETVKQDSANVDKVVEAAIQSIENTALIVEATKETAENTERLVEASGQTAASTKEIAEATERISLSLEAIRAELGTATERGGIIANPRIPSDFYHNARLYEQRGDYPNARRSYVPFFAFDLEVVDPHRRYQQFLVIQEGRAAALRIYQAMGETAANLVVPFVTILLEPEELRPERLAKFVEHHPEFGPAVWELSREYSKSRLGSQSLADMAREKELLEKFMQLNDSGHVLRYFLDQSAASEMIDDARGRLASLEQFDETLFDNPIRVSGMLTNTFWTVNLVVAEVAREIQVQKEGETTFESTGYTNNIDQRTGRPRAKPFFQVPAQASAISFLVKYQDIRGNWRGPFKLGFDPKAEELRWGKGVLDEVPSSWIVFSRFRGQPIAYFSHLIGYRYVIREVRYGIDSEAVDTVFAMPAVDPAKPRTTPPGTQLYVPLLESTDFISVQVTYLDGTKSKTVRFDRPPASRR